VVMVAASSKCTAMEQGQRIARMAVARVDQRAWSRDFLLSKHAAGFCKARTVHRNVIARLSVRMRDG